jgi:hypothetical protein
VLRRFGTDGTVQIELGRQPLKPRKKMPKPTEEFTIVRLPGWGASLTVTIECSPTDYSWVKLGLAVRVAHNSGASLDGASLDGASLDGASLVGASLDGASLDGASLDGARLDGASLVGASLDGASLDGASLVGARLDGASLVGASLDGARLDGALYKDKTLLRMIACASRSDGYVFYAFECDDGTVQIKAGCRWFTPIEFRAHVKTYGASEHGVSKFKETSSILDFIEGRMEDLGIGGKPKRVRKAKP